MTTTDLKKFIKNLVESRYMNKTVKFDDDWKFRVKGRTFLMTSKSRAQMPTLP